MWRRLGDGTHSESFSNYGSHDRFCEHCPPTDDENELWRWRRHHFMFVQHSPLLCGSRTVWDGGKVGISWSWWSPCPGRNSPTITSSFEQGEEPEPGVRPVNIWMQAKSQQYTSAEFTADYTPQLRNVSWNASLILQVLSRCFWGMNAY